MRRIFLLVLLLVLGSALLAWRAGAPEDEVLNLTRALLENIYLQPSAQFYADNVDPDVTAFEGTPVRVDGIDYHLFALSQLARAREGEKSARYLQLLNPRVQRYGETAIVTLTSQVTTVREGAFQTAYLHEIRVWVRRNGQWKLVHFHKSPLPGTKPE